MRMSDVVSSLGSSVYPILGMALFLSVFIGVIVHVTRRHRRSELNGAALLPLAEDTAHPASHRSSGEESRP